MTSNPEWWFAFERDENMSLERVEMAKERTEEWRKAQAERPRYELVIIYSDNNSASGGEWPSRHSASRFGRRVCSPKSGEDTSGVHAVRYHVQELVICPHDRRPCRPPRCAVCPHAADHHPVG